VEKYGLQFDEKNVENAEKDIQQPEEYPIPADLQPLMELCKSGRIFLGAADREGHDLIRNHLVIRELIRGIARLEAGVSR
jgi:hypothetical protein